MHPIRCKGRGLISVESRFHTCTFRAKIVSQVWRSWLHRLLFNSLDLQELNNYTTVAKFKSGTQNQGRLHWKQICQAWDENPCTKRLNLRTILLAEPNHGEMTRDAEQSDGWSRLKPKTVETIWNDIMNRCQCQVNIMLGRAKLRIY